MNKNMLFSVKNKYNNIKKVIFYPEDILDFKHRYIIAEQNINKRVIALFKKLNLSNCTEPPGY